MGLYVVVLPEHLAKVFISVVVGAYNKPVNTVRSLLVHPKDTTKTLSSPLRGRLERCMTSNVTAVGNATSVK